MRKIIAAMNMTLDGFCDHTAMDADGDIHQHYTELINASETLVYGRITYQLMEEYWPGIVAKPTGEKTADDFALAIDKVEKLVFSHTLKDLSWRNSRLASTNLEQELTWLKGQTGGDICIGSPGLIAQATNLGLVDEYQLSIHPVIAGNGLQLFRNITQRVKLKLVDTKTFAIGAVTHYYHKA